MWQWLVFVLIAGLQTGFIYWLHLPDDLLTVDPDGVVMMVVVSAVGMAVGSPYTSKHPVTVSTISGLILSSAVCMAIPATMWTRQVYYAILSLFIVLIYLLLTHLPMWISDGCLMAAAVVPFSILFLSAFLKSPLMDVAASGFAFCSIYLYFVFKDMQSEHGNVDLPCSLISAYCLSSFLVYGLLASPETLLLEYPRVPFFRVIGANDTVMKYTVAGLLLIVWLLRSLINEADEYEFELKNGRHYLV